MSNVEFDIDNEGMNIASKELDRRNGILGGMPLITGKENADI